jgi:hypothetical protein
MAARCGRSGVGAGGSQLHSFQMMAGQLFARALPALTEFGSPRASAFGLLGIHEYLRRSSSDSLAARALKPK